MKKNCLWKSKSESKLNDLIIFLKLLQLSIDKFYHVISYDF